MLKGHLMLMQAHLPKHERLAVAGAASGSYDITNISTTLRSIYRHDTPYESIH